MKKILTILGARPQFIKASAVSRAIEKSEGLKEVVIHTGQHFDPNMSDVFFEELGMNQPDHNLEIHGGGHGEMTGRMLIEIERVLKEERPDAVLVYGDTNSTLAGALAAVKMHIPVAHVEAGLRSFNNAMPEEINRILTDRISSWLFTPTLAAKTHLRAEGVADEKIVSVGDVMFDVALHHGSRLMQGGGILDRLGINGTTYVLATIHRAENTDSVARLTSIANAFIAISKTIPVVLPLHPRTRALLQQLGLFERLAESAILTEPLGYLDMVQLEKHAALIATDSGGVQKEAFFFKVPCVTLRDETEWSELVETGWNRLAPPVSDHALVGAILGALGTKGTIASPYGAGNAAQLIVERLEKDLTA